MASHSVRGWKYSRRAVALILVWSLKSLRMSCHGWELPFWSIFLPQTWFITVTRALGGLSYLLKRPSRSLWLLLHELVRVFVNECVSVCLAIFLLMYVCERDRESLCVWLQLTWKGCRLLRTDKCRSDVAAPYVQPLRKAACGTWTAGRSWQNTCRHSNHSNHHLYSAVTWWLSGRWGLGEKCWGV